MHSIHPNRACLIQHEGARGPKRLFKAHRACTPRQVFEHLLQEMVYWERSCRCYLVGSEALPFPRIGSGTTPVPAPRQVLPLVCLNLNIRPHCRFHSITTFNPTYHKTWSVLCIIHQLPKRQKAAKLHAISTQYPPPPPEKRRWPVPNYMRPAAKPSKWHNRTISTDSMTFTWQSGT